MRTFLWFVLVVCCELSGSLAQNNDNCNIPDIQDVQWTSRYLHESINDEDSLNLIFEPATDHNISIYGVNQVGNHDYTGFFNVTVANSDQLVVATNENFQNFESQIASQTLTTFNMDISILMYCTNSGSASNLNFRLPVVDTNNHDPEFKNESYTYKIPMPLAAGIPLTYFGDSIVAEDIDFSNQAITFTINSDDFTITSGSASGELNKEFEAIIVASTALRYTETQTFTITATDGGTNPGPRSSTATLIIEVDSTNSYPESASFEEAYYKANYIIENGESSLDVDGIITLTGGYDEANVSLSGDYATYFNHAKTGNTVTVWVEEVLPIEELKGVSNIILTLVARVDGADTDGTTVLIITLPEEDIIESPTFEQPYYEADYTVNDGVPNLVDGTVILSGNYDVALISLAGDYAKYFKSVKTGNTVTVSVEEALPVEELQGISTVILIVVATVDGADTDGTTVLIISLPEEEVIKSPTFEKPYYEASYRVNNGIANLDDGTITLSENYGDAVISLIGDYAKYFQSAKSDNTVNISVIEPIPENELEDASRIILIVVATVDGADTDGKTVMVISLPEEDIIESPTFEKAYYETSYVVNNDEPDLQPAVAIVLSAGYTNAEVSIEEQEYIDYFEVTKNENKVSVSVTSKLDTTTLQQQSLILTIVATVDGAENEGKTALVISLPNDDDTVESPRFEKAYYETSYVVNNDEPDLQPAVAIVLSAGYTNAEVSIEEQEHRDYFEITKNENKVSVSVTSKLDTTTLQQQSLILTIVATVDGAENEGKTALVISLPDDDDTVESPRFEKAYYETSYVVNNDEPNLQPAVAIVLSAGYTNAKVSIEEQEYRDYFEVTRNENKVSVLVTSKLDTTTLQQQSIILTIVAAVDGAENNGKTALVISLPDDDDDTVESPRFEKAYYETSYVVNNDEPDLQPAVAIVLSAGYTNAEVSIEEQGYRDYFEITKNENKVSVSVTSKLDTTTLQQQSLILTIVATVDGAENEGKTALVISLPDDDDTVESPRFEKAYYETSYVVNNDEPDLQPAVAIVLSAGYTNAKVSIEEQEYRDYFEVTRNENKVSVLVTSKLDTTTLQQQSIILTIVAAVDGAENNGKTALVISLPDDDDDTVESPRFEKAYYETSYVVNNDEPDLQPAVAIVLSAGYTNAEVSIEEQEYRDYFEVTKNENKVSVSVTSKLDTTTLQQQSLILTIVAAVDGAENNGKTALVISLPDDDDDTIKSPSFEKAYYETSYMVVDEVPNLQPTVIMVLSAGYENAAVSIEEQEYSEYFETTLNASKVSVSVKKGLVGSILLQQPLILTIIATVDGAERDGRTVLVISLPESDSTVASPIFEQSYYKASYTSSSEEDVNLEVEESIILSKGYTNAVVALEGSYNQYFKASLTANTVTVTILEPLDENALGEGTLVLTITATVSGAETIGRTVLIISLPESGEASSSTSSPTTAESTTNSSTTTECPIVCPTEPVTCPVTSSSTEASTESSSTSESSSESTNSSSTDSSLTTTCPVCTECPEISSSTASSTSSTTPATPEVTVEFDESLYRFVVAADFLGSIGTVQATSSNGEENIIYTITSSDGSGASSITVNQSTGEISNVNYLKNGANYFIVKAEGEISGATAQANLVITVDVASVCGDEVRTSYSLIVKHILEEEINYDVVELSVENEADGYYYVIHEQYPTNGTDLFEINSETGNLQSKVIDREWSVISGMHEPQISVTLRLVNDTASRKKRSSLEDYLLYETSDKTWAYVDNQILNIPNQVVVYVVVDDINDNAPSFETTNVVVGYPKSDVALEILPPYLTVVKATDPDDGYNASLYYSTESDDFYVHPTTGVVYVTGDVDSDTTFKITATDRNGTGLSSSINIVVKSLSQEEIAVLTTENLVLEDLEDTLSSLGTQTGLSIKYLTASVVTASESSRKTRDDSSYYLRIVAYGLDSNDQPVSGESLQEIISGSSQGWSVQTWESTTSSGDAAEVTGWVAAVSVLAVLLVLFIAGAGAFYYFILRNRKYENMVESREASPIQEKRKLEDTDSEVTNTNGDATEVKSDSFKSFAKNIKFHESVTSNNSTKEISQRRPTGGHVLYLKNENLDTTSIDSLPAELEPETKDGANTVAEDSPPSRERKKSVAFNDNVQKMQIERDEDVEDTTL